MGSRGRTADQRIGRLVGGQWRIDAIVGEGATSTVYGAVHRTENKRAAIKVLRSMLASDPDLVRRFLAEGYLVAGIEHPGVVKVLGDGVTEDGSPYIVLELLVGQTLEELRQARGGRIPLEEVMQIADAMMDTIAAVHDAGVTHRDLKPQNVMILDGGGVKIFDFGLAKLRGQTASMPDNVVGTPSFMPPEQALGLVKKMDARSDVWALGAIVFHALSGQPVHVAKHMTAMILASASTRPRSLADAAPELPKEIVDVVDRALSYRKADRWDHVRAMRSAWQAAHPNWLPTLPPPSYEPDPTFLDPNVLTPITTPLAVALFDPRDLVPIGPESTSAVVAETPSPTPPRRKKRSWQTPVMMVATAVATIGIVTAAIVLSADDRPARVRAAASAPPPPAMDLSAALPLPRP